MLPQQLPEALQVEEVPDSPAAPARRALPQPAAARLAELECVARRPRRVAHRDVTVGCGSSVPNPSRASGPVLLGKFVRFRPADLDAFVEAGRQEPVAPWVHTRSTARRSEARSIAQNRTAGKGVTTTPVRRRNVTRR